MSYTLTEAAAATGKARSTIFKACKSGKISYTTDAHEEIQIDPAELHRVYPPVPGNVERNVEKETGEIIRNGNGNSLLQQEIQFLREKLVDLERVKEDERRSLSERIEDLRHDRDDLRDERDRLLKVIEEQAGSFRLLTDERPRTEAPGPNAGRGFWARLRRKA
jgi:chromosome segregation ATPase